ncbi:cache domain-containing protein [Methanoplanus endosymbiosus]|uniref:Cache domain-containing protein n=1 Tax=Methanoplanus endosymbiosus TaxID=33865 RepID=A0A9E7PMK6_9EURY|nr:cache domain-containing protein [Methanoplanus endosymbiosus]UUX91416.1 cache domain-containing protein [Methanoplanus endosymbiosus]
MSWHEKLPLSTIIVVIIAAGVLLAAQYIFPPAMGEGEKAIINDLDYLKNNIKTILDSISGDLESASGELSAGDSLSSPEVQVVLDGLWNRSEYALSYATVNPDGTITAVAPEIYSGSVGIDITGSEPGDTIVGSEEPLLSDAFIAKEGFTGIEIAWPVLSSDGEYRGSVLAMADPSEFLAEIIGPIEHEKEITVTVMQPDGFILYDRDSGQVGKNLFVDEPFTRFKNLMMLGKTIAANDDGSGAYTFYKSPDNTGQLTKKLAYWNTLKYLGKEWRIIIFKDAIQG